VARDIDVVRTRTLEIAGGVRVVVPDSLNLLTPYVLFEQRDWFEDEIGFLRRLLRPGQQTIDVGANYGVYTLTMAKMVGPTGAVWAFEPATSTAAFLAQGIAANNFSQVVVECSAISSACGTAKLALNDNSEFNSLIRGNLHTTATETVPVVTLDDCLERYGWKDIDFMKVDAEGEETNILNGGRRFLTELSPLILYEVKAGQDLHLELVREFARFGFESYRLVPGLDLLVPFDVDSKPDEYLLNLFCCKKDRATSLAGMGLLLDAATIDAGTSTSRYENFHRAHRNQYTWDKRLLRLPYGATLAHLWETTMPGGDCAAASDALVCYAISQDANLEPFERYRGLENSFRLLQSLGEEIAQYLRLSTLTRVARDYGARTVAVGAVKQLLNAMSHGQQIDPSEPFLTAGKRFDTISPGANIDTWMLAGSAEEFERLQSFSSFYTGDSARPRLELIASLGFASEEIDRRLLLVKTRFGGASPILEAE
jgi:FkbM family methyltransferase